MDRTGLVSNILIAGKTGVGKSAFINYIYGHDVAESRAGSPVTAEGLHEYVSTQSPGYLLTLERPMTCALRTLDTPTLRNAGSW